MPHSREVSVIIAARNARATIGHAVSSALGQAEVAEVIVIDDASSDGTMAAACESAAGDPRLDVIRTECNIGPAAARNLAINRGSAPYIALLDADDRYLQGRLRHLLAFPNWDMVADDIAFFSGPVPTLPGGTDRTEMLDLVRFVEGNYTGRRGNRGELGFLKPVIRRDFLEHHSLAYDESIRLGEDYDLYVRCLQKGARFLLSHRVGYLAEVRDASLSSRHATSDLAALLSAADRHIAAETDAGAVQVMRRHRRQLRNRLLLREFLDRKATDGIGAAIAFALNPPSQFAPIAGGILSDKLKWRARHTGAVRTTLLSVSDAARP